MTFGRKLLILAGIAVFAYGALFVLTSPLVMMSSTRQHVIFSDAGSVACREYAEHDVSASTADDEKWEVKRQAFQVALTETSQKYHVAQRTVNTLVHAGCRKDWLGAACPFDDQPEVVCVHTDR